MFVIGKKPLFEHIHTQFLFRVFLKIFQNFDHLFTNQLFFLGLLQLFIWRLYPHCYVLRE